MIPPPSPLSARVESLGGLPHILVIKHGALGDFIQALAPMQAIRKFHRGAYIALLTTAPFSRLASESGLFDEIRIDERAPLYRLGAWLGLGGHGGSIIAPNLSFRAPKTPAAR